MRRRVFFLLVALFLVFAWSWMDGRAAAAQQNPNPAPAQQQPVQPANNGKPAPKTKGAGDTGAPAPQTQPNTGSGGPADKNAPTPGSNGAGDAHPSTALQSGDQKSSLTIDHIEPAVGQIAPNQPLVLVGTGFKDGAKVTLSDPSGTPFDAQVVKTELTRLIVIGTFGMAGKWTATVEYPDNSKASHEFQVQSVPPLELNSPRVYAFGVAAGVATLFLIVISIYVLASILRAQASKDPENRWSLADALSEESIYQPKVIQSKKDVILLASSSRVIALVGLMGILSTVLGFGYSIMWNLTIFGTVPDLTQVRSFLLGSACLFAPYLANQLSGMFTPSNKPAAPGGDSQAGGGPTVTALAPAQPAAGAAAQGIHLVGTGFQDGPSVTLIDPLQTQIPVAVADITAVSDAQVSLNATLATPGPWKVAVANRGSAAGPSFDFTVNGPPTIAGLDNAAGLTHGANAQTLTFRGKGFMSGLTVKLTDPTGASSPVSAMQLTATMLSISATLPTAGNWQVVVTNPGNNAATFPFQAN